MKRRKFLIGLGALSAGGAAAMGTGAVEMLNTGQRIGRLDTTEEPQAYFRITPGSNGESGVNGEGEINPRLLNLNPDAISVIDDVYRIHNSRDDTVDVWVEDSEPNVDHLNSANNDSVEGFANRVRLDPGETLYVALRVDGTDSGLDLDQDGTGANDPNSAAFNFTVHYQEV